MAVAQPTDGSTWTSVSPKNRRLVMRVIGFILAAVFSAIVVFAQELVPGNVGTIAGVFFGLALGSKRALVLGLQRGEDVHHRIQGDTGIVKLHQRGMPGAEGVTILDGGQDRLVPRQAEPLDVGASVGDADGLAKRQ